MNLREKEIIQAIEEKLPDRAKDIISLFRRDETFREVCEDYVLCLHSMNKIINTRKIHSRVLKEYKEALAELELEMLTYISADTT